MLFKKESMNIVETLDLIATIAEVEYQAAEADRMGYNAVPKWNRAHVLKMELRSRIGWFDYYLRYRRSSTEYAKRLSKLV